MNSINALVDSTAAAETAFVHSLGSSEIHHRSPAAFADFPHPSTKPTYSFLPTQRVLDALQQAGFLPVGAAQARSRPDRRLAARHVIRLRRRYETVQLTDTIPEIIFINGHDGRTASQFRLGLFRPICTNGLIVSIGDTTVWRFPHRSELLDAIVAAVLQQSELFAQLGNHVARMERTQLEEPQRLAFAAQALALRFPPDRQRGMQPSHLLVPRRPEDVGDDLWRTYNVVQEHLIKGGLTGRSQSDRLTRSRKITAIREDVRINTALWEMATALAA
jgi:hypothetical protein